MADSVSRRLLLTGLGTAGVGAAMSGPSEARPRPSNTGKNAFVTVDGTRFVNKGETYRFVGANIWYGAYLGSPGAGGDRERLKKELDTLKALGIDNLRVLGSSELSPLNNSLDPAFSTAPGVYNEDLMVGLDFLLAEMGKRDMKAVVYLTNFWEWSGGMVAYQYWTKGNYINNGDPNHPWPEFADFSAQFYSDAVAKGLYWGYVRTLLTRTNTITGTAYRDDTAVMAWQLSNEPRPGGEVAKAHANVPDYLAWISDTAKLIRSLAPHHLVSLGHEGLMGAVNDEDIVVKAHEHIDYLTAHIWPQNWSWVNATDLAGSFDAGAAKVSTYINQHIEIAQKINKPLVFEEFGFPRDNVVYEPGTSTQFKDRFYGLIYGAVEDAIRHNTPVAGSNFWAWGGMGRALHPDYHMLRGETAYVGDPPHEPQGWYSVFNNDTSTQALIKAHAKAIRTLSAA